MIKKETPTLWLPGLKEGEERAAEKLWEEYFLKIVKLAKNKMNNIQFGAVDEEDIAISAMKSFCKMARKRDEVIADSTELWKLLATITKRKVIKERKRQHADCRQENLRVGSSKIGVKNKNNDDNENHDGLKLIQGEAPDPHLIIEGKEVLEQIHALLESDDFLKNPKIHEFVTMKSQGWSNSEIAEKLGTTIRTVQRWGVKLEKAWIAWQKKVYDDWKKRNDVERAEE